MRRGKRLVFMSVLIALLSIAFTGTGFCFLNLDYKVAGHVMNQTVIRDLDGFQTGVLNDTDVIQVRNELKFDLTMRPKYVIEPNLRLDKVFIRYRGAYDAIFDLVNRYNQIPNSVRGAGNSRYDLGLDDVIYENDLREAFADIAYQSSGGFFTNMRLGRQIVQWGEAGLFNVVNQVNPQDLSIVRNFQNPEDLAAPIWIGRMDISSPPFGMVNELSLQLLYIPDNRPTIFGPNYAGGVAPYGLGVPGVNVYQNDVSSDMGNPQFGARVGLSAGRIKTYFYYFDGFYNNPALDFSDIGIGTIWLDHPRYQMYGVSFNYDSPRGFILRGEGALHDTVPFTDFGDLTGRGYTGHKVYEALIGVDRSFFSTYGFPGAGGTPLSTSFEVHYKHVDDWDYDRVLRNGAKENNYGVTFVANTFFMHGSLLPVVALWYDFHGVLLTSLSADYTPNGLLFFKIAISSSYGNKSASYSPIVSTINSSEVSLGIGYRF